MHARAIQVARAMVSDEELWTKPAVRLRRARTRVRRQDYHHAVLPAFASRCWRVCLAAQKACRASYTVAVSRGEKPAISPGAMSHEQAVSLFVRLVR
jgi:hypothetical protein